MPNLPGFGLLGKPVFSIIITPLAGLKNPGRDEMIIENDMQKTKQNPGRDDIIILNHCQSSGFGFVGKTGFSIIISPLPGFGFVGKTGFSIIISPFPGLNLWE